MRDDECGMTMLEGSWIAVPVDRIGIRGWNETMKQTIEVLNQLELDGVFGRYAIAGAIAATFYIEPLPTYDLDVFVLIKPAPGKLISLTPIYARLKELGFKPHHEHVVIHGIPVQFIPVYNRLSEGAMSEARAVEYDHIPTRVIRPEHLLAIMLQTSRSKDLVRARLLADHAELDAA
jgi:hypothetical protein